MRLIDADVVYKVLTDYYHQRTETQHEALKEALSKVPTVNVELVQPIEEFEWCRDCKEYDQNAHCCHRWTKVIRNTVNDLKTQGYEIVRHGRWVNHISENGATDGTYCGICDYEVDRDARYNYCPNCGARMDGERREDVRSNDR